MKKLLALLAMSVSLSGCFPLQVADLMLRGTHAAYSMMNFAAGRDVIPVPGQRVYEAPLRRVPSMGNNCDAKAILVQYGRDWDVLDSTTGEVRIKANPDEIYDQAILAYGLMCDGKPAEDVLLVTDRRKGLPFLRTENMVKNQLVIATSYFKLFEAQRPKWMPQVIRTIQNEAATNPAAQEFLAHVEIEDGLPVEREVETPQTDQAETAQESADQS